MRMRTERLSHFLLNSSASIMPTDYARIECKPAVWFPRLHETGVAFLRNRERKPQKLFRQGTPLGTAREYALHCNGLNKRVWRRQAIFFIARILCSFTCGTTISDATPQGSEAMKEREQRCGEAVGDNGRLHARDLENDGFVRCPSKER